MATDPITKPLVSVMQSTAAPPQQHGWGTVGAHCTWDTQKKTSVSVGEEGYRVTMETDSPTPVADGGW